MTTDRRFTSESDLELNRRERASSRHDDVAQQFNETKIRHGFVRKVYAILGLQLLVTIIICAIFMSLKDFQLWVVENTILAYVLVIIVMIVQYGLMMTIICCDIARKKFPLNMVLLFILTALFGLTLGFVCALSKTRYVFYAAAITVAIVLGLTLFAFQNWIDFTSCWLFVIISSVILVIFGFVAMFMQDRIINLVYCCFGVLVVSFMLVYDTQLMLGGNHQYAISPEEYIIAALSLYIDIILIFQYILEIIRAASE